MRKENGHLPTAPQGDRDETGGAWELRWKDFDFDRASVTITPEKGSNARQLRISGNLISMLNALPHRYEYCFRNPEIEPEKSMRGYQKCFEEQRKLIAQKLQNPRINAITFRTLRHFCASTLYHRTRDILLVKAELGHKSLTSTLVYTHLISFKDDDYICKINRGGRNANRERIRIRNRLRLQQRIGQLAAVELWF